MLLVPQFADEEIQAQSHVPEGTQSARSRHPIVSGSLAPEYRLVAMSPWCLCSLARQCIGVASERGEALGPRTMAGSLHQRL